MRHWSLTYTPCQVSTWFSWLHLYHLLELFCNCACLWALMSVTGDKCFAGFAPCHDAVQSALLSTLAHSCYADAFQWNNGHAVATIADPDLNTILHCFAACPPWQQYIGIVNACCVASDTASLLPWTPLTRLCLIAFHAILTICKDDAAGQLGAVAWIHWGLYVPSIHTSFDQNNQWMSCVLQRWVVWMHWWCEGNFC
jgi:hypothetical protein